jgi:hypothetical protein
VSSVASKAFDSIQDRYPPATIHGGIISITALVPEPILQATVPELVADFHTAHPQTLKIYFSDQARAARPAYNPVRDYLSHSFRANVTLIVRSCLLFKLAAAERCTVKIIIQLSAVARRSLST